MIVYQTVAYDITILFDHYSMFHFIALRNIAQSSWLYLVIF